MEAEVECPRCHKKFRPSEVVMGKVQCRYCRHVFPRSRRRLGRLLFVAFFVLLFGYVICLNVWKLLPAPKYVLNEVSTISAMRVIESAQEQYYSRWERMGTFEELYNAKWIDPELANATSARRAKNGYYFALTLGEDSWSCLAMPAEPGKTGRRSFYIDESGAIHWVACESEDAPPAGPHSSKLGG